MNNYIEISEETKNAWQGQRVGVNIFWATQDVLGRWVVSENSLKDFPEAFEGYPEEPTKLELSQADFVLDKAPEGFERVVNENGQIEFIRIKQ